MIARSYLHRTVVSLVTRSSPLRWQRLRQGSKKGHIFTIILVSFEVHSHQGGGNVSEAGHSKCTSATRAWKYRGYTAKTNHVCRLSPTSRLFHALFHVKLSEGMSEIMPFDESGTLIRSVSTSALLVSCLESRLVKNGAKLG
jgi:hypothetical protein